MSLIIHNASYYIINPTFKPSNVFNVHGTARSLGERIIVLTTSYALSTLLLISILRCTLLAFTEIVLQQQEQDMLSYKLKTSLKSGFMTTYIKVPKNPQLLA